ncbi:hypothetical protein ACQ4PT_035253 [Festuca glaucescens]
MESTGSCTRSTAPAPAATSQALAIRGEGNKLAQKNPASSRAPSSASKKKAPEMLPFKCKYCPRMFATARGRTVHETKVHKDLRRVRQNKKQKEHRHLATTGPLVSVSSSLSLVPLLRSAYFDFHVQLFKSTRSTANAYLGTEGGGQVRSLREVNYGETAHGINNFPSLRSGTMPIFPPKGSGTSSLPGPSFAALAPAADGNGRTGDGVHLGRLQDMPKVNQDETTDGIDLTLRL